MSSVKPMAQSKWAKVLGLAALASANAAIAQEVPGGLTKATETAQGISTGFYAFVGVVCVIYLLVLALLAKMERKSWSDFGMGVFHVSLAGSASVLAAWAWVLFTT